MWGESTEIWSKDFINFPLRFHIHSVVRPWQPMAQVLEPLWVPIVHNDLTVSQSADDIFHALERLSTVVDNVFSHIGSKVSAERNRLQLVNSRVATCLSKIQMVKGTNRATTVFSTAKYPAPKELPQQSTMFSILGEVSPHNDSSIHYNV